ncbi:hypothetical protein EVAR_2805_1 [Eumeta japonica]|uniref:Uncharacterized protein n=1 Tax=Eumeta variegata TaxID=151549 RepID=A0A4C1T0I0_EUMVA|nr:hypothetical protein EVAR_2805_1 [Eumeta japonica]
MENWRTPRNRRKVGQEDCLLLFFLLKNPAAVPQHVINIGSLSTRLSTGSRTTTGHYNDNTRTPLAHCRLHRRIVGPEQRGGPHCSCTGCQKRNQSRINAVEMRPLCDMCGVSLKGRRRNERCQRTAWLERRCSDSRVEKGMLRRFGHLERMRFQHIRNGRRARAEVTSLPGPAPAAPPSDINHRAAAHGSSLHVPRRRFRPLIDDCESSTRQNIRPAMRTYNTEATYK